MVSSTPQGHVKKFVVLLPLFAPSARHLPQERKSLPSWILSPRLLLRSQTCDWPGIYAPTWISHCSWSKDIFSHDIFFRVSKEAFDRAIERATGFPPWSFVTSSHEFILDQLSWSSSILANSIASCSVWDLNMHTSAMISSFKPPINVPIKAFCGHPNTPLAKCSNSLWYSPSVLCC